MKPKTIARRASAGLVLLAATLTGVSGCALLPQAPAEHTAVLSVTSSSPTIHSVIYNVLTTDDSVSMGGVDEFDVDVPWEKTYKYTDVPEGNVGGNSFSVIVSDVPVKDEPSEMACTITVDGTVVESQTLVVEPGKLNQITCEYSAE